jgi:hypothetical protein
MKNEPLVRQKHIKKKKTINKFQPKHALQVIGMEITTFSQKPLRNALGGS